MNNLIQELIDETQKQKDILENYKKIFVDEINIKDFLSIEKIIKEFDTAKVLYKYKEKLAKDGIFKIIWMYNLKPKSGSLFDIYSSISCRRLKDSEYGAYTGSIKCINDLDVFPKIYYSYATSEEYNVTGDKVVEVAAVLGIKTDGRNKKEILEDINNVEDSEIKNQALKNIF